MIILVTQNELRRKHEKSWTGISGPLTMSEYYDHRDVHWVKEKKILMRLELGLMRLFQSTELSEVAGSKSHTYPRVTHTGVEKIV